MRLFEEIVIILVPMKVQKAVFLIVLTIGFLSQSNACDLCGCSTGSSYLGIVPQFHRHFLGVQYQYRSFRTNHDITGSTESRESKEVYESIELRMRYNFGKRLQLFTFIPLAFNRQSENGLTTRLQGISDATVFVNYSILNSGDSVCSHWKHNLQIGAGAKMPTGSYKRLDESGQWNPNIQLGSGSTDLILDAIYTVRYKGFGWSNNLFVNLNGINTYDYRFGNKLNLASQIFYWKDVRSLSILPNLGIQFQNAAQDVHNRFLVEHSGGTVVYASLGTDLYIRNIAIGLNGQFPIHDSNQIVSTKPKLTTTLIWLF